jgi:hypothetical protein
VGIFNWMFEKKRNKPEVSKVEVEKKPSTTSTQAPQSLDEFAWQACKSKTTISVQMREIHRLTHILEESLKKEYPDFELDEVIRHTISGLTLRCPTCGQFGEQAVQTIILGGNQAVQTVGLGSNAAALLQGQCPGCSGSTVVTTFDPARIKARKVGRKVAYVLIMKRGSEPENDSLYVQQVLKRLAPEAFDSPGVKVHARFQTGPVDQTGAVFAAMEAFGADVGNNKYDLWTEDFSDADGDGGLLLKAFYKQQ